jgi:hypothetical protein
VLFVFLVLEEETAALTLLLPMRCVDGCVLLSATPMGCWLVEAQNTSRIKEPFEPIKAGNSMAFQQPTVQFSANTQALPGFSRALIGFCRMILKGTKYVHATV